MQLTSSTVQAIALLRSCTTRHYFAFAGVVAVFTGAGLFVYAVGAAAMQATMVEFVNGAGLILAGGAGVCAVLILWGFLRWEIVYHGIMGQIHGWENAARDAKYPPMETTELPTYLPTEPETRVIPVSVNGGAGQEIALDLVNGFDPRTLDWFAMYLAKGNRTSENALEKMPVPYDESMPPRLFGGATPGTPLTRLLDLCQERGILSPRDDRTRKSGKLLVTDENEIRRLLKVKGASDATKENPAG